VTSKIPGTSNIYRPTFHVQCHNLPHPPQAIRNHAHQSTLLRQLSSRFPCPLKSYLQSLVQFTLLCHLSSRPSSHRSCLDHNNTCHTVKSSINNNESYRLVLHSHSNHAYLSLRQSIDLDICRRKRRRISTSPPCAASATISRRQYTSRPAQHVYVSTWNIYTHTSWKAAKRIR
jgi:hypothetical protein